MSETEEPNWTEWRKSFFSINQEDHFLISKAIDIKKHTIMLVRS